MGVESCLIFIPRNLCSTSTESFAKSLTADTSGTGVEAGLGLFATRDWPNNRLVAHYGGVASGRVGGLQFSTCFWSLQMFLRSSPIGVHWWSSQTFLGPCRIKNQLGCVFSFSRAYDRLSSLSPHCRHRRALRRMSRQAIVFFSPMPTGNIHTLKSSMKLQDSDRRTRSAAERPRPFGRRGRAVLCLCFGSRCQQPVW